MARLLPAFARVVFCGLSSTVAQAQSGTSPELGIEGGATLSKASGYLANSYAWFSVGGFARFPVSRILAIQTEVFYVRKAKQRKDTGFTITSPRVGYVEVPVLAVLNRRPGRGAQTTPRLYAGPELAIQVTCSNKYADPSGVTTTAPCDQREARRADFGLLFGAGIDIGRAVIDVRFDLGFRSIERPTLLPDHAKNRALSLLFGWKMKSR